MQTFVVNSVEELIVPAQYLLLKTKECNVVFLEGEMGSGKTTFVSQFLAIQNTLDKVSSPTYSLVNEYKVLNAKNIYHFDLYRLKNTEEAIDMGIAEYFNTNNICIIEWPKLIQHFIQHYIHVKFEKINENSRTISINIIKL